MLAAVALGGSSATNGGWQLQVGLADLVRHQLVRIAESGVLQLFGRADSMPVSGVRLSLHDGAGNLIVSANSDGASPRELRQFLEPGDYFVAAETAISGEARFELGFTPSESPVRPVRAGSLPASVASADMDGDGILDLLVANVGRINDKQSTDKGDLAVLFGVGDGSFRPGTSIRVGDNPIAVAVHPAGPAGAGLLAVTANRGGNSISVLRISTTGEFAAPLTIPVGIAPNAVVLADFDGDDLTDIAVANAATDEIGPLADENGRLLPGSCSLILQTQTGGFIKVATLPTGGNPEAIAVGNLDTDGLPDLVFVHPYADEGQIVIYCRAADGSFDVANPRPPITVGFKPSAVAIGDIDGDGRKDIVVANSMSDDVSVVRQLPNGQFAQPGRALPVGTSPYGVLVIDVDDDRKPDIVTVNQGSNDVTVLRGIGDGAFLPATSIVTGSYPSSLVAGHFDADGAIDLVTADLNDGTVSFLRGFGDGGFLARRRLSAGSFPYAVAVDDLNGDGRPDLVAANRESHDLSVMLGRGDGSFGERRTLPLADFGLRPMDVHLVDINGDARLDIVTANEGLGTGVVFPEIDVPGGVCILFGLGDGTFTQPQVELMDSHPTAVAVADVNGDKLPDIVAVVGRPTAWQQAPAPDYAQVRAIPSGSVHVLLQQLDGTFSTHQVADAVGRQPVDVVVTDLDGDRAPDIVFCTQGFANFDDHGSVAVMYGDGRGDFSSPLRLTAGDYPQSLAVKDVDGDKRPDIVVVNVNRFDRDEVGDVSVLLQERWREFVPEPVRLPVGLGAYGVLVGDFIGDRNPDIVVSNSFGKSISMLAGDGKGSFAAAVSVPWFTAAPAGMASGDIDRDGRPDLVTANLVTNDVTIMTQSRWTTLGDLPNPLQGDVSQVVRLVTPTATRPGGTITVDRGGSVIVRRDGPGGTAVGSPSGTFALCSLATRDGSVRFAAVDTSRTTLSIHEQAVDGRLVSVQRIAAAASDDLHPAASVLMRVVSADLDGDGWGDVIVTNPGSGTVDVLVSGKDGSFDSSAWQRLDAGVGPARILVTDVSGDGVPDLVAANQVSGCVWIRLGVAGVIGTAAFTASTGFKAEDRIRTSAMPYGYSQDLVSRKKAAIAPFTLTDIGVGDIDGDGLPDIVAVNSEAHSLAVLRGTGHGKFAAAREHRVRVPEHLIRASKVATRSIAVHDVAIGQFNSDTKADVALLDRYGERLLLYPGGSLSQESEPAVVVSLAGNLPRSISVADVTGPAGRPDGIVDLVVGNDFGDVLTLQGVGDGTFRPYVRADRSVALLAADMDGDGQDDFIYGNKGLDRIQMDRTATRQSFTADRNQGVLGPSAVATVTETIGGKQYKNLVVANGGANQILLFRRDVTADRGSGEMFLPEPQTFYVGTNPSAVFVGDVNRDGIPDVVVANEGSNDISVMLGMSDAEGRWTMKAGPRLSSGGSSPAGITVGDFAGGDGIPDIAVTNRGSNSAAILRGIAGGFFNDTSPTFLPLSITAPGPILPVARPGAPPLLAVGSTFGNQFQTFAPSGAGYASSRIYSGGGATLASTTFGGSTYLAAGSSAGGVSIFLSGPSTLGFLAPGKASLPGLTGLAFDSAGRLFGMSPAQDSALNLFSFDSTNGGPGNFTANNPLLAAAQAFVTRLVFTPLTTAGVGLVATLVTSEGVALADRDEDRVLENPADGDSAAGGGDAENAPVDDAARGPDAGAEKEVESNPLLDFVLGVDGLLATWNKRLASLLLQRTDDAGDAGPEQGEGDADAAGRAADRPAGAGTPAAGAEDAGAEDPRGPDTPRSARESAAGPAAVATSDPFATREHAPAGAFHGWGGQPSMAPIRPPETTSERRSAGLVGLLRAIFAFLQAG